VSRAKPGQGVQGRRRARFASLGDWLRWQETLHVREIDLGLDRCRAVADRLGLAAPPFPVVTVAGTNGKGSSVAMLAAVLHAAGYRVGSYTSPHLLHYNERIQLDRVPVDDAAIMTAFERIDAAREEVPLTYFEFGTLAALDIFHRARPDVVILETGLGGRLDAVNIIDCDVALLTAIDIDHVEWLGPDRESIGREKAGIFRAGRVAVCADPRPPASIALEASRIGAQLHQLGAGFGYTVEEAGWRWHRRGGREITLPPMQLLGEYQYQNAAGVIMALELLGERLPVAEAQLRAGITGTRLPGRFQMARFGRVPVILDVAHNPHAAAALARNLMALGGRGRLQAVFGMLRDKDAVGVVEKLRPFVAQWHVVSLGGPRGAEAGVLAEALASCGVRKDVFLRESVEQAIRAAAADPGGGILVFGSFLTVAAAQRVIAATAAGDGEA